MTLRTIFKYAGTGLLLLAAVLLVGQPAITRAQSAPLPFVSVQPRLFGMPNSYSNSWGDFDNDGYLDLAVSLGSGEVRLYRNDNGTLVSVGKEMGLPQAGGDSYELRGLSWGDYDGDGFLDLLGGSTPTDKPTTARHQPEAPPRQRASSDRSPARRTAMSQLLARPSSTTTDRRRCRLRRSPNILARPSA